MKILKGIDLPGRISNQHEIQGVSKLRELLGDTSHSRYRVLWRVFNDVGELVEEARDDLTWYDARANNPKRSPEWRFYYRSSNPLDDAEVGDLLLATRMKWRITSRADVQVVLYIVSQRSQLYQQLLWLLKIHPEGRPKLLDGTALKSLPAGFSEQSVLAQLDPELLDVLGVSDGELVHAIEEEFADFLTKPDYYTFPSTQRFALFAQNHLDIPAHLFPDAAIDRLLELETIAFHFLERRAVERVLESRRNYPVDVDEFISFSLSVQNRRKARRGRSLENHLAYIFTQKGLEFEEQVPTEEKSTIDFLFPNHAQYKNLDEPIRFGVVALAAKTTLKERWRQVLAEAAKMEQRHLFTLESGISAYQTREMGLHQLSLVTPQRIVDSFPDPGTEVLTLSQFCDYVKIHAS